MRARQLIAGIWRVNAVIILIGGILGVGVLSLVLYLVAKDVFRRPQEQNVMSVGGEQIDRSKATLAEFEAIKGTPYLRARLFVDQEIEYRSGGMKEARATQNVLYFDTTTQKGYWLIPQFKGIITASQRLPDDEYTSNARPGQAYVYALVHKDTNGDGRLTDLDVKEIAVSNVAGKPLYRVRGGVESLDGAHVNEDGSRVLIFFTVNSEFRLLTVEMSTGKVLMDSKLEVDGGVAQQ